MNYFPARFSNLLLSERAPAYKHCAFVLSKFFSKAHAHRVSVGRAAFDCVFHTCVNVR